MGEVAEPEAMRAEAAPKYASTPATLRKGAQRCLQHAIARNALALYGLQIAGYVLPLVTIPYLARTLHPRGFGLLLFFQSFALWASLTIEYGFNLSGAREIAKNIGNTEFLAAIASSVLGAKLLLLTIFFLMAGALAMMVANFREHPFHLMFALLQTLAFGFSPFWYFQGTQRMAGAATVDFLCRASAAAFIFVLVLRPEDGWKALALQGTAGCVTLVIQMRWMYKEIGFQWPRYGESFRALRAGWDMFVFRGAYHIYGSANAFILGLVSSIQVVGYFGSAERISKPFQGLTIPFTQALYPHMSRLMAESREAGLRFARLTIALCCGTGVILALIVALLARWFVSLMLGPAYAPAVSVLYIFALILPINAFNTALIMQWMLPLGKEKIVGRITLGAIGVNLIAAALLAPRMGHVGMAWSIFLAEACKAAALISTFLRAGVLPTSALSKNRPPMVEF